jgi:hypothetical protein
MKEQQIRQADMVRPSVGAHADSVATLVVGRIGQKVANA